MSHDDFQTEPVRGLPAHLPEGEHIVWQGAPDASAFARSVLRIQYIAGYFFVIAAWKFGTALYDGKIFSDALASASAIVLAGVFVLLLVRWYARAVHKSTVYTITNRRVVMRIGVALPVTFNLPYAQVENASFKSLVGKSGNIVLDLKEHTKISWAVLWPHVRPWHLAQPQPALRAIPDIEDVARLLSRQLHAFHNKPLRTEINTIDTDMAASRGTQPASGKLNEQRA